MPRLLQIGSARDNKFLHQDGTNKATCQVQMPGTNLASNPMHGVLNNNPHHGMRKILPNNNSLLLAGERLTRLHNNKLPDGDKRPLNSNLHHGMRKILPNNNSLLLAGERLTRLHNNKLPDGDKRPLNSNLHHGMRKILPNNNSLLHGMHRVQRVRGDSSRGKRLPLRLTHGHNPSRVLPHGDNRVTNLLHQQHMAMVAVRVSRGLNQLK